MNLTLGSFISLLVLSSSVSTGEQKCMEVWRWILHKPWSLSAPQSQAGVPAGSQVTTPGSSAHEFVLLQTGQQHSGAFSQSNQWKGEHTKGMKGVESVSLSQGVLEEPNSSGDF